MDDLSDYADMFRKYGIWLLLGMVGLIIYALVTYYGK